MKLAQILCFRKHQHNTSKDVLAAASENNYSYHPDAQSTIPPMFASFSSPTNNISNSIDATTIIQGLQSNCLARWSLTQSIHDSRDKIVAAMDGNTSLRDLYIGADCFANEADDLGTFLHTAAQKLRGLESVAIGACAYNNSTAVYGTSIAALVQAAPQLQILRMERNLLVRSLDEARTMSRMDHHPALKRVSLPSLHPTSSESCSLDPLLQSFLFPMCQYFNTLCNQKSGHHQCHLIEHQVSLC